MEPVPSDLVAHIKVHDLGADVLAEATKSWNTKRFWRSPIGNEWGDAPKTSAESAPVSEG